MPSDAAASTTSAQPAPLLPVYLINGDDELKRETTLKRLSDRIAQSGDLLLDQQTLAAGEVKDPEQLIDALNTPPFGGGYRLVVLKDADKPAKELAEALIEYLDSPTETTVLAIVANKLAANTRLYKAIVAANPRALVNVESVKRQQLPSVLVQLTERFGISLEHQAALSLIERVGTSTVALDNEIRRLAAWAAGAGKQQLTVADIIEQVPALIEPKPWELADALCLRDAGLAVKILAEMRSAQPTSVFTFCVSRLREVLTVIALKGRGISSASQIASRLNKQEWQIRSTLQAAERFSEAELTDILRQAQQVEAAMKSGADAEQELILWLVQVCLGMKTGAVAS